MSKINHPDHYGGNGNLYEAIKVIESWKANFNLGNCLKYICRAGKKGDALEDLYKAKWYLEREIQNIENDRRTTHTAINTGAITPVNNSY